MKTCCFTGPRSHKLNFINGEDDAQFKNLVIRINKEIEKLYARGIRVFMSGMAEGVDTICAEAVLALKALYNDVSLVAVLPYNHKASGRSLTEKKRFFKILENADSVVTLQENYSPDCYYKRNEYMVDNSDMLLAVYSESGGTAYTINYAAKKNKPIKICPQKLL